ncbi:unnamed protein product [Linum trigynum]|uniref:Uncharacterized protein n=1 Tax=Linum trigynum TaxID=586398 RepID=A0AAV2EB61_9ROSI
MKLHNAISPMLFPSINGSILSGHMRSKTSPLSPTLMSASKSLSTANVVAIGDLRLLEAIRSHFQDTGQAHIRYYQVGSFVSANETIDNTWHMAAGNYVEMLSQDVDELSLRLPARTMTT